MPSLIPYAPRFRWLALDLAAGGHALTLESFTTAGANVTRSDSNRRAANSSGNGNAQGGLTTATVYLGGAALYCELEVNAVGGGVGIGIAYSPGIGVNTDPRTTTTDAVQVYRSDGQLNDRIAGTIAAYGATFTTGDVIGLVLIGGRLYFSKNGAWQAGGNVNANTGGIVSTLGAKWLVAGGTGTWDLSINVGQRPFRYAPPDRSPGRWESRADAARLIVATRRLELTEGIALGRLANDPGYAFRCNFQTWGSGSSSSTIGDVDLANGDGLLDYLLDYDNRDRVATLYRGETYTVSALASAEKLVTGIVESLKRANDKTLRIKFRDRLAFLDVGANAVAYSTAIANTSLRSAPMPCVIGANRWVPFDIIDGPNLHYGAGDRSNMELPTEVRANGVALTYRSTWGELSTTVGFGIRRLTNPGQDKHCAQYAGVLKLGTQTIAETFGSWTGDNPNGWTVQEQDANNAVTQNPAGECRLTKNGGGTQTHLERSLLTAGQLTHVRFRVTATPVGATRFRSRNAGGTESADLFVVDSTTPIGTYTFTFTPATGHTILRFLALAGATATGIIDDLEVWPATRIQNLADVVEFLAVTIGQRLTTAELDTAALAAIDTALPYGYAIYIDRGRVTVGEAIQRILDSIDGAPYVTIDGKLSACYLTTPGGTPVLSITDADITGEVVAEDDTSPGLSRALAHGRNYAPHDQGEIAGAVQNTATAGELMAEWMTQRNATLIHAAYKHADNAEPMETCLNTDTTNAANELARRLGLRRTLRKRFTIPCALSDAQAALVVGGSRIRITSAQAGLSAGRDLVVFGKSVGFLGFEVVLYAWG